MKNNSFIFIILSVVVLLAIGIQIFSGIPSFFEEQEQDSIELVDLSEETDELEDCIEYKTMFSNRSEYQENVNRAKYHQLNLRSLLIAKKVPVPPPEIV